MAQSRDMMCEALDYYWLQEMLDRFAANLDSERSLSVGDDHSLITAT